MTILRIALAVACAAVLGESAMADGSSTGTAAKQGTVSPVPATMPLPPPLPAGKTTVVTVNG